MKCGLLGRKLGHSYSPQIHALLGDYPYVLYEKEPQELEEFLKNGDFTGINVTMPYKKDVIPFLDVLTPCAQKLGAVNTIVRRDGRLIGHNTDYFGFSSMLDDSGLSVSGKKVLVLGSGGASNTAVSVLRERRAFPVVVSRNGQNHYGNLNLHADAALLVNATPVGMYPKTGVSPVSLEDFPALEGVLDIIYNPARTKLMLDAESRGLVTRNGLLMLVAQAKEASEWFTGTSLPADVIGSIHAALSCQMQNIILIGMPGCGKTTLGQALARETGRVFADTDSWIVENAGKSIPEIFAQEGETVFRDWETRALEALGKESGLVIATGGGCVTKERNYPLLHQNGTIFWLQRSLEALPTQGRPLSQGTSLDRLYRQRENCYRRFADHIIDNNGTLSDAVEQILAKEVNV